jgi:hypothetical protein
MFFQCFVRRAWLLRALLWGAQAPAGDVDAKQKDKLKTNLPSVQRHLRLDDRVSHGEGRRGVCGERRRDGREELKSEEDRKSQTETI